MDWIDDLKHFTFDIHSNTSYLDRILRLRALQHDEEIFDHEIYGRGKVDAVLLALSQQGGIRLESNYKGTTNIFRWSNAVVKVYSNTDNDDINVEFYGAGEVGIAITKKLIETLQPMINEQIPDGTMHIITQSQQGLGLSSVGQINAPLVRENYQNDVLNDYDHMIECLQSGSPCGRIAILDGQPGTGKSYIIRSLPEVVEAIFVIVAPSLVGQLSGPQAMPPLLQAKKENLPIVLIMEDADAVLVNRKRGNQTGLAEVLNLGDGLLGQLVDVRIIATTNAEISDMDPAIIRPGRLCRRISTRPFIPQEANKIRQRLLGDETKHPGCNSVRSSATLADVYRAARKDGWTPVARNAYRPGNYN